MANKIKYREKKQRYYCTECEKDSVEHKPDKEDESDELRRRCKICKKETVFMPWDDWG